ncbi:MAG: EAL domain-containing protein [Xanthomonadales bacterium]|nr:EAL domain-containing protein [Xanthomonadales bacterium]
MLPIADTQSPSDGQASTARLLLVASDRKTRDLVTTALVPEKWQLSVADDGHDTLAELIDGRPDLLILNSELEEGSLWICEQLRSIAIGEHLPILVLIPADDRALIADAYEAGATDYFLKTGDYSLLPHRVRYVLRTSSTYASLRQSQQQLSKAQELADIGHWELSLTEGSLHWSSEVFRIHGRRPRPDKLSFDDFFADVHEEDRSMLQDAIAGTFEKAARFRVEHRIVRPDTTVRVVQQRGEPILDDHGSVIGLTGTIQDISEQREAQEEIRNLAYFDTLTGLGNRPFFNDRLEAAVGHAQRVGERLAVIFFDLDDFKTVNDTLGHAAGDTLLKIVSERVNRCVREGDTMCRAQETARLGGDEFTLILAGIEDPQDVAIVAERIRRSIARPFEVEGEEANVSASIGIAVFPEDGDEPQALVSHADMAMYQSKSEGGNRYNFFRPSMVERIRRRKHIINRLGAAVREQNLSLVFQPIVRLTDCQLVGAEALVRWSDPELGNVSPEEFVPVAEETGAIAEIGEWVLTESCRLLADWEKRFGVRLNLSVNISSLQFMGGRLHDFMNSVLTDTGISPDRLQLELSDRLLMDNLEEARSELEHLTELGVTLCIEHVGRNPTHLSGLASLPLKALKVDRQFIQSAGKDAAAAALVASLIGIGRALDLQVIAEGVENDGQYQMVRDLNCEFGQGYLFAAPLSDVGISELLQQNDLCLANGTR